MRCSLILLSLSAGAILDFTCSSVLWTLFWSSADSRVWASKMSLLIEEYVPWFGAVRPANRASIWSFVGASPGGQHAKANLARESTRLSMRASISSAVRFTSRPLDFRASFDSNSVPMVWQRLVFCFLKIHDDLKHMTPPFLKMYVACELTETCLLTWMHDEIRAHAH